MTDIFNTLTPSQKKLLKDREQWMKDVGENYTEERTRIDAIYDLIKQYPTESIARKAVESGGDPVVLSLYYNDTIKKKTYGKRYRKSKTTRHPKRIQKHKIK